MSIMQVQVTPKVDSQLSRADAGRISRGINVLLRNDPEFRAKVEKEIGERLKKELFHEPRLGATP